MHKGQSSHLAPPGHYFSLGTDLAESSALFRQQKIPGPGSVLGYEIDGIEPGSELLPESSEHGPRDLWGVPPTSHLVGIWRAPLGPRSCPGGCVKGKTPWG